MTHEAIHFPILKELGLTETEAMIYELLLGKGPQVARDLVKPSGIGRGNVYNVLVQLQTKGLILSKEGKHTIYEAVDPSNLRNLLDRKLQEAKRLERAFSDVLPQLSSAFTLSIGKPAIQIFEGLEGVERVLADSLTTQGEILTIVDPEAISQNILDIEARYIKKRVAKQISKRIIMPDTPIARTWIAEQPTPFTQNRLAPGFNGGFNTAVEIYDQRLSYITLSGDRIISVLINEKNLAALQRAQFEYLWLSGSSSFGK